MSDRIKGLAKLIRTYGSAKPDSFGLYLGAGVNLPPKGESAPKVYFKTYDWKQLLEALYKKNKRRLAESFEQLCQKYKNDWLGLAAELVGGLTVGVRARQVDEIIYNEIPRKDKDGRLSRRLLKQAPTLHAAIAFSTTISEQTANSWTFQRNPKIGTVVTPNYDFFFGAGWTCYQAFDDHWKVQTPFSEGVPTAEQRRVNYIHGYLPYKLKKKKEIVLTRESYRGAYAKDGFAANTLEEAIRRFNLIFLGTSFADPPLCKMLRKYKGKRRHFAIVTADTVTRASQLGVSPVVAPDYGEVAKVLAQTYCSDLSTKECRRVGLSDPDAYWKRLLAGPVKSRKKKEA
jgi:hypothetical protein